MVPQAQPAQAGPPSGQPEACLPAGRSPALPASGAASPSEPALAPSIPRPAQARPAGSVPAGAEGGGGSERGEYEARLIRSNSFQEYGRRERKEDEGSMEDAADKRWAAGSALCSRGWSCSRVLRVACRVALRPAGFWERVQLSWHSGRLQGPRRGHGQACTSCFSPQAWH